MITGTEVGRLTPKLVTQIRRFLPTARQMAEQRLNQTIRAEMNFVRRRGIINESIHFLRMRKCVKRANVHKLVLTVLYSVFIWRTLQM